MDTLGSLPPSSEMCPSFPRTAVRSWQLGSFGRSLWPQPFGPEADTRSQLGQSYSLPLNFGAGIRQGELGVTEWQKQTLKNNSNSKADVQKSRDKGQRGSQAACPSPSVGLHSMLLVNPKSPVSNFSFRRVENFPQIKEIIHRESRWKPLACN